MQLSFYKEISIGLISFLLPALSEAFLYSDISQNRKASNFYSMKPAASV
ncbi:hypothetical protein HMPREF8577_0857 [Streptococcus parasanguinis ATCC 903]|nr:hypothetical protein HMPREF8577_0857 [Streptococcus parasanguinis ATCC 903]